MKKCAKAVDSVLRTPWVVGRQMAVGEHLGASVRSPRAQPTACLPLAQGDLEV